jgi:hypothetical protein
MPTDPTTLLQYGAIGVSALALLAGAKLLVWPPQDIKPEIVQQWNSNVNRFYIFAVVIAVIAAGIELAERVIPNRTEDATISQLSAELTAAQDSLKQNLLVSSDLKQKLDRAETQLKAVTSNNLFATQIQGYAESLSHLSQAKRCLDSSLIPDAEARALIIGMLDNMDSVLRQIAHTTGQPLSQPPPCHPKQ